MRVCGGDLTLKRLKFVALGEDMSDMWHVGIYGELTCLWLRVNVTHSHGVMCVAHEGKGVRCVHVVMWKWDIAWGCDELKRVLMVMFKIAFVIGDNLGVVMA